MPRLPRHAHHSPPTALSRPRAVLDPNLQLRAGTVFHSPAIEALRDGREARDADVDAAAIVLMGGIAAEALVRGSAEGGLEDERALETLITTQHAQRRKRRAEEQMRGSGGDSALDAALDVSDETAEAEVRARARWAAASAVLLLREYRRSFDALCEALEAGQSVGECASAIEGAATAG